jgi:hypothetical protein
MGEVETGKSALTNRENDAAVGLCQFYGSFSD